MTEVGGAELSCLKTARNGERPIAPNLNRGQDTRANRTRHTASSSTQPHANQQLTNAPQTNLTFTRTHSHTSRAPERRPKPTDTAPHDSHTHSATPTRERARQWNHRLRELHRLLRERLRCLRASPGPAAPAQPRQALSLESGYMRIGYTSRYKSLPCPLG